MQTSIKSRPVLDPDLRECKCVAEVLSLKQAIHVLCPLWTTNKSVTNLRTIKPKSGSVPNTVWSFIPAIQSQIQYDHSFFLTSSRPSISLHSHSVGEAVEIGRRMKYCEVTAKAGIGLVDQFSWHHDHAPLPTMSFPYLYLLLFSLIDCWVFSLSLTRQAHHDRATSSNLQGSLS